MINCVVLNCATCLCCAVYFIQFIYSSDMGFESKVEEGIPSTYNEGQMEHAIPRACYHSSPWSSPICHQNLHSKVFKSPNQLNWLFSEQRSRDSTLNPYSVSEHLVLSVIISSANLLRKLNFTLSVCDLLVSTQSLWSWVRVCRLTGTLRALSSDSGLSLPPTFLIVLAFLCPSYRYSQFIFLSLARLLSLFLLHLLLFFYCLY